MGAHDKYLQFLKIIFDQFTFEEKPSFNIPFDDFKRADLSINDVRRFFQKAKIQKLVNKESIHFTSSAITPLKKLQFEPSSDKLHDDAWFKITVHGDNLLKYIKRSKARQNKSSTERYWINKKSNGIWVNNEYLLSKPNYDGKNALFFDYIFDRPNRKVSHQEIKEHLDESHQKSFLKIINELGFTGEIKKAFFPKTSGKRGILFRKLINQEDIEKEGINEKLLIKELEVAHFRRIR